jgi:hypothetical protein
MANIVDLLQKLITHERSAREIGSVAEAETFAAKIQTMLTQHKLSMSEVEYEAQEKLDPIDSEFVRHGEFGLKDGPRENWLAILSHAVAQSFFCRTFYYHGCPQTMIFVGRDSDRKAAIAMYSYLCGLAVALCEKEFLLYKASDAFEPNPAASRIWKKSFKLGFVSAIGNRLRTTRVAIESTSSTQGMILIRRDEVAINDWMTQRRLNPRMKSSAPSGYNSGAAGLGQRHGSQVSLKARSALTAGCNS